MGRVAKAWQEPTRQDIYERLRAQGKQEPRIKQQPCSLNSLVLEDLRLMTLALEAKLDNFAEVGPQLSGRCSGHADVL